jgi:hypothetical protein
MKEHLVAGDRLPARGQTLEPYEPQIEESL